MIIGEKNLIIGKIFSIISETSISLFFYFEKQSTNFIMVLRETFSKIPATCTSPPHFVLN